jgi:hypothetical protein
MGDFDDEFIRALKTQSWSLYGVGMAIIAVRLYDDLGSRAAEERSCS